MNLLGKPIKRRNQSTIKLVLVIIVSIIIGMSYIDLKYNSAFAQALQELCTPDRGINTSQSNCFSNAPTQPVYNNTNTNNVRPPPENTPTFANESN
ncbi:hypothetical protein [Candidatus Nitrosocosmicus hydrocola]|uniref:hypothetical protein n=1 Tax=Candidatus Nitrosocosmicus hydrocola TaxID=1826872 RepID=UPI0011E59BA3|nr:hypothetical protein [Candidatus Nitrosocosmicus hydrocola]